MLRNGLPAHYNIFICPLIPCHAFKPLNNLFLRFLKPFPLNLSFAYLHCLQPHRKLYLRNCPSHRMPSVNSRCESLLQVFNMMFFLRATILFVYRIRFNRFFLSSGLPMLSSTKSSFPLTTAFSTSDYIICAKFIFFCYHVLLVFIMIAIFIKWNY